MKLRIKSKVKSFGRAHFVEEELRFLMFKSWSEVGSTIGYDTEKEAKAFAEDYGKGEWVSDSATFQPVQ